MDTRTFRLVSGPRHVIDAGDEELVAHYEASFSTPHGALLERFLTDKGRAALLRRIDEGRRSFSGEELEELSVEARRRSPDREDRRRGRRRGVNLMPRSSVEANVLGGGLPRTALLSSET